MNWPWRRPQRDTHDSLPPPARPVRPGTSCKLIDDIPETGILRSSRVARSRLERSGDDLLVLLAEFDKRKGGQP